VEILAERTPKRKGRNEARKGTHSSPGGRCLGGSSIILAHKNTHLKLESEAKKLERFSIEAHPRRDILLFLFTQLSLIPS
jgi:hypothetical protein